MYINELGKSVSHEYGLTSYIGPARVLEAYGPRVRLEMSERDVWGIVAIPYPYRPEPGDLVLIIGRGDDMYVIGVIEGKGTTTFTCPGDLKFFAPKGKIDFASTEEITIRSPKVRINAKKLEFIAQTVIERFENARRFVKETLKIYAGRMGTIVESTYRVKGMRIIGRAKKEVKLDGRKIHLG